MIYFDSAATSFQKPPEVAEESMRAMKELSSPGRGGYTAAEKAAEALFLCRSEIQELFGASSPEQVVFTMNATHALNIAIKTLVPEGGAVAISGYEHNAVTRPLAAKKARITAAGAPLFDTEACFTEFDRVIAPGLSAVICTHVSNVFGFVLPVERIAALCRERGVPLIIDASQSAGVLPLDLTATGAAFIAMPGHKGLYGPQGTGVLLCGENILPGPLMEGGTGSRSREQEMPPFLPDRLEAGTHNVPGICGLLAGVRFVRRQGQERILHHERLLTALAAEGLRQLPGMEVFARNDLFSQSGVLSFRCIDTDVELLGEYLSEHDAAVRAGLHCAPLAHQTAGTAETGTVRVSFSAFNTKEEVFRFLRIMERFAGEIS